MNNEEKILSKLEVIDGRLGGIDGRLNSIDGRIDGIDGRLNGIDGRLDGLEGRFDGLEGRFVGMRERQVSMEIVQNKLVEEVISMKDYMYNELATKQELHEVENRLTDQMDGLVRLHQDHDVEICALNSRMGRVERHIFGP